LGARITIIDFQISDTVPSLTDALNIELLRELWHLTMQAILTPSSRSRAPNTGSLTVIAKVSGFDTCATWQSAIYRGSPDRHTCS